MTNKENPIEPSIVPIKMADLIGYIARRRKLSFADAMCYFYNSPMAEKLYDENAKWWYLNNETLYEKMEQDRKKQDCMTATEEQFVVFCTEAYARQNSLSSLQAYALFREKDLLTFLKDNYDVLHTQGEEYILDEIKLYLKRRKKV